MPGPALPCPTAHLLCSAKYTDQAQCQAVAVGKPLPSSGRIGANVVQPKGQGARMRRRTVIVNDKMQKGHRYVLSEPVGRNFDPEFQPELTPKQMLELGVFGGKYMTDCQAEFPKSW